MNLKIKGNHGIELTEAIKNYTEEKIFEASKRFKDIIGIEIDLEKTNSSHHSGENYQASAKIIISGKDIFIKEIKSDLYAAIDALKDKIEYELSSLKDKRKSVFKKISHKIKNLIKNNKEN